MNIAVIGGGPAGLSAAMRLKESGLSMSEIVVFEKQLYPGGLLQSAFKEGYWWDNGVFKFSRSSFLAKLIPDLFQQVEDYSVKVWYKNKLHSYYISLKDIIFQLSLSDLIMVGLGSIRSYGRYCLKIPASNLHEWLCDRMTSRLLGEIQLETYIGKLQGCNTYELSPILGDSRLYYIPSVTEPVRLMKVFSGSFRKTGEKKKAADVLVCKTGVGMISQRLADMCNAKGIKICYGAEVKEIINKNKSGFEISYDDETGPNIYRASHVISTMPLDELVPAFKPQLTNESLSSAKNLKFMDMQVVFFIINKSVILNRYLILYSFEKHHKWKRLVARSLDGGLSSVMVEITFIPGENKEEEKNIGIVERDLTSELKLFKSDEILAKHTITVRKAYPVYEIGFEKRVSEIIKELEASNLQIAGRQGRFLYANTSAVIQTAIDAADRLIKFSG